MGNTASQKSMISWQKAKEQLKMEQSEKAAELLFQTKSSNNEAEPLKVIHELKLKLKELEMQNEQLRITANKAAAAAAHYEFSPSGFFTLASDGTILEMNLTGARMLGKERMMPCNCNFMQFVSPETLPLFIDFLMQAAETHSKQIGEVKLIINENSPITVYLEGFVAVNEQKCLVTAIDITGNSKEDEAIQLSQSRLKRAELASKTGNWELHLDQKKIVASAGAVNIYGTGKDQFDLEEIEKFTLPQYRSLLDLALKELVEEGKPYDVEFKIKAQDTGEIKDIHSIALYDHEKRIMFGTIQDISDRKQAEEELRNSERRYSSLFANKINGMAHCRIITDEKGKPIDYLILQINEAYERIIGIKKPAIEGRRVSEVFPDIHNYALDYIGMFGKVALENGEISIEEYFEATRQYLSIYAYCPIPGEFIAIITDVTQRKQSEEVLAFQSRLLSEVHDGVFSSDTNFKINYWNQAAEKMFGWTKEEALGKNSGELLQPRIEGSSMVYETSRLYDEDYWIGEVQYRRKDGTYFFAEVNSKVLKDSEGKSAGQIVVLRDITQRRRAEEELRESEEKYRRIIETANEGIILGEPDGKITFVNRKMADMLGYSIDEIIGKTGLDLLTEDQKEKVLANRIKLKRKNLVQDEYCFKRKDESLLWTISGTAPIVNGKGEHTGNIAMHTDISDRKRAEERLAFKAQLLSEVHDAVFSSDSNSRITYWNRAAERMFGWTKEEALGHTSGELLQPATDASTIEEAKSKLKKEGYWMGEGQYSRKDGTSFFVEVNATILKNADGKYAGQIVVSRDITERKKAEADLIAAKEKAEESDRLKSAFLANMSHELRTPLNSIIGFSELLTDPDFDLKQESRFAQIIHTSGNHLLAMINDIMDISKIEAGQVKVINGLFSVNQLMAELQEEYSLKAHQKGIEIILDPMNPVEEVFIENDQTKIRQILVNLVGNAIKFTEKGFIQIGVSLTGKLIEFQVKDTGIGIPAEFQSQIFERFRQVESYDSRKYGGTGLGLAISKSLTELLGGTIWMESKKGEGSTFHFTIPLSH